MKDGMIMFMKQFSNFLLDYLSPLRSPLNAKNGSKLGCKVAEESVSKYTLFSTKFLRWAIETLKKVKAKGKHLDEITNSSNLGK